MIMMKIFLLNFMITFNDCSIAEICGNCFYASALTDARGI